MKTSVPQFSWWLFYYYTTTTSEHYFVQKKMPARVTRVPTRRWVNPTTTKTIVHRFFCSSPHLTKKSCGWGWLNFMIEKRKEKNTRKKSKNSLIVSFKKKLPTSYTYCELKFEIEYKLLWICFSFYVYIILLQTSCFIKLKVYVQSTCININVRKYYIHSKIILTLEKSSLDQ